MSHFVDCDWSSIFCKSFSAKKCVFHFSCFLYMVTALARVSSTSSLSSQVKCPLNRTSDKLWKKLKLCVILEASCAGQKVDCPGYCVGLHNFAPNKIFGLPLLIKIWNDNLANLLPPIMYVQTKLSLITNCLLPNSSKRGECYLCN